MKNAAVIFAVFVALVAVGAIAYRILRPQGDKFGGFRDWVKNPDYKRAAAEYYSARESLTVPDDISDAEIRQMVDRLFVHQDEDFNLDRLKLVGAKATPFLIAAIDDSKTANTQFSKGGHALDAQSPLERLCQLLAPIGPPEAARPLGKFMDHQSAHFRKEAAMALGNIGTAECIDPMLKALDDDDDYVRSYAMMGIQRGMKAGRCSKEFLEAMFPPLTKLLNRNDKSVGGEAPELLLAIDSERALPVLLSPDYFTTANKEVHYILRAFNSGGYKVPHHSLLPFLKAVKPLADKYPHGYEYAEALIAYAHNPDASAEETFRAELKSSSDEVQESAAKALAILSGVTNAPKVVFDALEKHGFDGLSRQQKHYFAAFIYNAEVNNGGHSQYFVNSSGERWQEALEGLQAMGASGRADILREATALFGASGPSRENEPRHRQLASFTPQQDAALDTLDSKYYACKENVEALLAQYAIDHKEHFVPEQ